VAAATGAVYALILAWIERAEEAFHFLEYGLFAVLVLGALGARRRAAPPGGAPGPRWAPAAWAVALTAAAGLVDEAIQGILPTRYWDLRDLCFNALAGVLAVAVLTAAAAARSRDRAATAAPPAGPPGAAGPASAAR
jgi:VanZ family protein